MADTSVSRNVFFAGAWRTTFLDDLLMKKIVGHIKQTPGLPTKLTLTAEGLELLILNRSGEVTRTDKLPLENILDVIHNKFNSLCMMAVVKGKEKHLTVFSFLCKNVRHTADIVQSYKIMKQQLSGEGYNFQLKSPKGKNWTLKSKPVVVRQENGDVWITPQPVQIPNGDVRLGEARVIVTDHSVGTPIKSTDVVQTRIENEDRAHHDDKISYESFASNNTGLREEIYHISEEVKAIKLMLEGTKGAQVQHNPVTTTTRRVYESEYVRQPATVGRATTANNVHFSSSVDHQEASVQYAQPTFRKTLTARRRDFGPGMVMVRSKRERSNNHVVRPVSGTYYETVPRARHVIRRVHSGGPPSPTSPQPYLVAHTSSSSTIPRPIEDVYRHRSSSRGSRAGRPVILINPAPAETVLVAKNGVERAREEQREMIATVSEHVPVEVEQRVVEVYNVEDEKTQEQQGVLVEEVEEGYDAGGENDSKVVNFSTIASENKLADLDEDEDGSEERREVIESREEVTVIRTEVVEEQRPIEREMEDIETEQRVVVTETEYLDDREGGGILVNHVEQNGDVEARNGLEHEDIIELKEEKRVVKRVVIVDALENSEEEEDEEPYVMDEERLKAFSTEKEIVIVERDGGMAVAETEETNDHFDQTGKETSETTVVIETTPNGDGYSRKAFDDDDVERELLETDAYRSESTVLF